MKVVNLKIKVPLPNFISNYQTNNDVREQVDLYLIYIPTKYKENLRTLLIFRPIHPSIHPIK